MMRCSTGRSRREYRGNPEKRRHWAADQVKKAAKVSRQLGLDTHVTFPGSLAWPYFYPYPQRPDGLIEACFEEQARRWKPILDEYDHHGVDVCFEIHPSEDMFDGDTFELFLDKVGGHKRCNINYDASHFIKQGLDYLGFIDVYHERIKAFHVKDAEFNPTAKQGYLGGYKGWLERAARDRSLGDGQVNFKGIFSRFAAYDYAGWAVYEWECCLQHPEAAARNGAKFINDHIIEVTDRAFDDFAATGANKATNLKLLGWTDRATGASSPGCGTGEENGLPGLSHPLQRQRHPLAHADAERHQGALAAGPGQLMGRRQRQARAGHAERMAQRNGAAVGIDEIGILRQPELAEAGDGLGGEGLVQLDDVEIADGEAEALQQLLRRRHRPDPHDPRRHAGRGHAQHPCPRRQPVALGRRSRGEQQSRRPIIDARGIAGGDGAGIANHRLQLGERGQGRIGAGMLVVLDQIGAPLPAGISTGTISSARKPDCWAATARCCERSANSSCASRWIWNSSATFSAVSGMESMPYCASIRGLTKRQPMVVSSILGAR